MIARMWGPRGGGSFLSGPPCLPRGILRLRLWGFVMEGRLVWMTREQRDWLEAQHGYARDDYSRAQTRTIWEAFDAAPADPAEAAHSALCSLPPHDMPHYPGVAARAVLAALGVPPEAS